MKRSEFLVRSLIITGILLTLGAPLYFWNRTPLIHARMSEDGGWTPDVISAEAGQPLHLRFTSDDVMHGFAVGQMDMQPLDIEPGKVADITLTLDKPGVYTFFCTRWCGVNHWRMRGTIEVSDSSSDPSTSPFGQSGQPAVPGSASIPLYVSLGLDIDAPHESPEAPERQPSALRGKQLVQRIDRDAVNDPDVYKSSSPYQIFQQLGNTSLDDSERWDVVAYIWQSNTTLEGLQGGRELYDQNCAACHGENGAGDGVFADDISAAGEASMGSIGGAMESMMQAPADFADAKRVLGASPAILHGKILRGGMGTGMPMWGSIFSEEQIWDLVAYLYSFQFEYEE